MGNKTATIISWLLSPLLVPTYAFAMLLYAGPQFSMLSWEIKRFILIAGFFSTGVLPLATIGFTALNKKLGRYAGTPADTPVLLLLTSVYYYIGYFLLNRLQMFAIFKLYLLASVLGIVVVLLISLRWNISRHMAAIGTLPGLLIAWSFRSGTNPAILLAVLLLLCGILGTARLALGKNTLPEVIAGFTLGFSFLYLVVFFA